MRELAQKIADSQRQEIKEFDQWLKSKGHDALEHGAPKKGLLSLRALRIPLRSRTPRG